MSRKLCLHRIEYNSRGSGKQPIENRLVPLTADQTIIKCDKCSEPINTSYIRLANQSYHLGCFVCYTCSRSLRNVKVKKKMFHLSIDQYILMANLILYLYPIGV